jgi:putative Mg2+ transporter-C (MgtC) family protein
MLSVMTTNESSPTRVAAQVVSGIGFLGAGVIMRDGLNIRGLNTAATLWCSAAIGTLTGAGFLVQSLAGVIVILAANILLRPIAHKIDRQPNSTIEEHFEYCIEAICRSENETHIRTLLLHMVSGENLTLFSLKSEDIDEQNKVLVEAHMMSTGRAETIVEKIVSRVSLEAGITSVSWKIVIEDIL